MILEKIRCIIDRNPLFQGGVFFLILKNQSKIFVNMDVNAIYNDSK
jgi:hypothetical protein